MPTAFVLSGGGSLGAVQVGMLQALQQRGEHPDLLVGSSAGAMNAAFVAGGGFTPECLIALEELWCGLRRRDVFPLEPRRQLLALAGLRDSLCTGAGLDRVMSRELRFARIEDAAIPLHVVATDLSTGLDVLLSTGSSREAILASTAIPAVFPPVDIAGRVLVDGGIANNTPISHAVSLGADRVVVLPAGTPCALQRPPRTAIGVALQSLSFLVAQRLTLDVAVWRPEVELVVLPPLCPVSVSLLDFRQARSLVARARAATTMWLDADEDRDTPGILAPHGHPELNGESRGGSSTVTAG